MKKVFILIAAFLLLFILPQPVSAAAGQTSLYVQAVATSNGNCQVTVNATIHKTVPGELLFSVPKEAVSVSVNGKTVHPKTAEHAKVIDLSSLYGTGVGDYSFSVNYTLRGVVQKGKDGTSELSVPLLSSCNYKIDVLRFSLTLPGTADGKPGFRSGYHQNNIEKDILYDISGNVITGSTSKVLIDHETLVLTLSVPEAMFPKPILNLLSLDIDSIGMAVCAILAILYWIWKLRCLPPRRTNTSSLPEGFNAGQLGTVLGLQNANLSLMVFSWAQLGYLRIRPERGRVVLLKRMDMGNERSEFERRNFNGLFARGDRVDCSGYRYAMLCQKAAHTPPPVQHLVDKRCGNRRIFRGLSMLCGLFSGIGIGLNLGFGGFWQPVLAVLFAVLGAYAAIHLQNWAGCLFLPSKRQFFLSTLLSVLWIFLSILIGQPLLGVLFVIFEFVSGILAYYGGIRTEDGREIMAQVIGFRRYLKHVSKDTLDTMQRRNPDYFFEVAPYALALGVGKTFSKQFGAKPFRECPYIEMPIRDTITAAKWIQIMENTLEKMDANNQSVSFREVSKKIHSLTK